jgi:antirestriction protein ArdC
VTAEPSYNPRLDLVTLPHLSQFESAEAFWATLYHEVVHATGAPRRLNRFSDAEGDGFARYSFEELVAEFGAAFLCAFAGISNAVTEALQASYIQGWSQALRSDSRLIVRAASAAQRAADYIRGKFPAPDPADAP